MKQIRCNNCFTKIPCLFFVLFFICLSDITVLESAIEQIFKLNCSFFFSSSKSSPPSSNRFTALYKNHPHPCKCISVITRFVGMVSSELWAISNQTFFFMMLHHHEPKSHTKSLDCCLQSQDQNENADLWEWLYVCSKLSIMSSKLCWWILPHTLQYFGEGKIKGPFFNE